MLSHPGSGASYWAVRVFQHGTSFRRITTEAVFPNTRGGESCIDHTCAVFKCQESSGMWEGRVLRAKSTSGYLDWWSKCCSFGLAGSSPLFHVQVRGQAALTLSWVSHSRVKYLHTLHIKNKSARGANGSSVVPAMALATFSNFLTCGL